VDDEVAGLFVGRKAGKTIFAMVLNSRSGLAVTKASVQQISCPPM
jgi:hypothetical protein